MRVAVAYEIDRPLVVEDLPTPAIGPHDVLVRLRAGGICHTDLTVIRGLSNLPPSIVPATSGCGSSRRSAPRSAARGRRPCARARLARLRDLLVVPQRHVEPLRVGTQVSDEAVRLPDARGATAVCGCGTSGEAMVVHEASVVPVHTDLADDQLALLGCGVTTGLGAVFNTAGVGRRPASP